MNCIFICIFNQLSYVEMFYLLLESILNFGNLDNNTHILIYTCTDFMNMIKQSNLFSKKIFFEINDTYTDIDKACKARLDLFYLSKIKNYDKILYLDTDILIKGDIKNIFDVCREDILYVLEEGEIDNDADYWGKSLFGNEVNNYHDKTAFTSGMLLFNNCDKIKNLFDSIIEDIHNRHHYFHDQPYIVYNAFKYNLYDNKILKSFAVNNDNNIHSDKVIHHFPGGPGVYHHKMVNMNNFLNNLKDFIICRNIETTKSYVTNVLLPVVRNSGELLEGNIFMTHNTTHFTSEFSNRSKNISNLVLNKNIKNVMEIGFNSGFSTLLMLLSNPNITVTCFDTAEHSYVNPCYKKMKETFGDRINLIVGNSAKTLPNIHDIYDLIHIDGSKSCEIVTSDIINSYRLSRQGTVIIFNDYNFHHLSESWNTFANLYNLRKLNTTLYGCEEQDIKYVEK